MSGHRNTVQAGKSNRQDAVAFTRRHFIIAGATAAGGLAVGIGMLPRAAKALTVAAKPWDGNASSPYDLDAWIAIEPDDSVLIRYARSEMGQGSMTALPMIVAEELQCDWSKVRVEYASPNRSVRENNVYGDMSSVGSHSVRDSRIKLQQGGAMECAGVRMQGGGQRRQPCRLGPPHQLWRAGKRGGADQARGGAGHQGAGALYVHRQAAAARRRAVEGQRRGAICNRHAPAGHGLCRHRPVPGAGRHARERR